MEISEERDKRESLIEDFGLHIESEGNIPPLAARMLAHLIINNRRGSTFEEMVDVFKASKSSVCTNLNILQHKGRITYYTQAGDRKRYFTIAPDVITDRLDEKIRSSQQKINLCNKIIDYKKEHVIPEVEECVSTQIGYLESFRNFLEQYKSLCDQHKQTLINLKNK